MTQVAIKREKDPYVNLSSRVPAVVNDKAARAADRLSALLGIQCKTGDVVELALDFFLEELERDDFLARYMKRRSR